MGEGGGEKAKAFQGGRQRENEQRERDSERERSEK